MNRLIITLCSVLLMLAQGVYAQSNSAKIDFERGMNAYHNKNYEAAVSHLTKAAFGGVTEAYEPLINIYADGEYDGSGKGNYRVALSWTVQAINKYFEDGGYNAQLAATCMMYYDPLCFLTGDYQEAIDHGIKSAGTSISPYLLTQIAASYLKLGDTKNANEWLKKAKTLAKKYDEALSIHTANAIISKMYFDKKNYSKALEYSEEAVLEGKVPLAAYVYGASRIKTNNSPSFGKQWVEAAAKYDYNGIYEINCFEDEIKQYWESIKDITF